MNWIKVEDDLPKEQITVFVAGEYNNKFWYGEAEYNPKSNSFDEPYYGQHQCGSHSGVKYWAIPTPPKD